MSRSTAYRSSDVAYNGELLFDVHGGAVSINGTTKIIRFVAPCDGTIEDVNTFISTLFSNAAARLRMGTPAAPTSILNDFVLTNLATGYRNLKGNALLVSTAIVRGQAYEVGLVNADTTGEMNVSVVISPN